jgi:LytS/YehU family sensor histidine kinase
VFCTRNSVDPHKEKGSGIGLSATRKRLALLYKEDYMLAAQLTAGCFETTLKLPVP